jgi:hypothetical protein
MSITSAACPRCASVLWAPLTDASHIVACRCCGHAVKRGRPSFAVAPPPPRPLSSSPAAAPPSAPSTAFRCLCDIPAILLTDFPSTSEWHGKDVYVCGRGRDDDRHCKLWTLAASTTSIANHLYRITVAATLSSGVTSDQLMHATRITRAEQQKMYACAPSSAEFRNHKMLRLDASSIASLFGGKEQEDALMEHMVYGTAPSAPPPSMTSVYLLSLLHAHMTGVLCERAVALELARDPSTLPHRALLQSLAEENPSSAPDMHHPHEHPVHAQPLLDLRRVGLMVSTDHDLSWLCSAPFAVARFREEGCVAFTTAVVLARFCHGDEREREDLVATAHMAIHQAQLCMVVSMDATRPLLHTTTYRWSEKTAAAWRDTILPACLVFMRDRVYPFLAQQINRG